jgi:hypothetical protein
MARYTEPDLTVVDALCRGVRPVRKPTFSERLAAVRHLASHGYTDPQIAHLIGLAPRSVQRLRADHGISGQPVGTNGHTRRRVWPLEARNVRK